jgi:predicted HicB family RNase H-like nuclease
MMSNTRQAKLRLPAELWAWLAEQAKRNGCSINSEVVRAIRDRIQANQPRAATNNGD